MENNRKYSVLMSVYYRENAEYLEQALNSIIRQTVVPTEIVLVCDGPLTEELDKVIDDKKEKLGDFLKVIRLEKNGGLGNALRTGLEYCSCNLVARMDSDDVSKPDRCEKQLKVFELYPDVSIVSGTIEEFFDSPESVVSRRQLPEFHDEIIEYAKSRNPFNHPCVMFKKEDVIRAGSYQDFYLLEDYYLWIRMLTKGYKGYNLREPILSARTGLSMFQRRGGLRYIDSQIRLFEYMHSIRFITYLQFLKNSAIRTAGTIVPNGVRKAMYLKYLRN